MTFPDEKPTVRARAVFSWEPPEGPLAEFTATLYSTRAVALTVPGPLSGLVVGLEWSEENQAIISSGGFWSSTLGWDTKVKQHLLLKGTNALRRELGLPPHSMTAAWPGTE